MLDENITKAQHCATMLANDIQQAISDIPSPTPPSGDSQDDVIRDRAILAYLNDCLTAARALQSKMYAL